MYIGMGDGVFNFNGDANNRAQNPRQLLGKMLRIDVNDNGDGLPYDIPPDNPFVGDPIAREEIWVLGMRNPWRFSFDRLTGDLYIADVGHLSWEEINRQPANSDGGQNYGWRLMEGPACYNPPTDCNDGSLTLPIYSYPHEDDNCAIIGGYVYRGSLVPRLDGVYLYSDSCSGRIWALYFGSGGELSNIELLDNAFQVSTFGETEGGEICFSEYFWLGEFSTIYCLLARP